MPIRVKHKLVLNITEAQDGKDCLFNRDDTKAEVVIDSFERNASGKLSIAAAATEQLSFGDVAAVKGCYLQLSGDAIIKFNNGSDLIQLRKATGQTLVKFFIEADITQLDITAPAAEVLTGTYCVWGDPAS